MRKNRFHLIYYNAIFYIVKRLNYFQIWNSSYVFFFKGFLVYTFDDTFDVKIRIGIWLRLAVNTLNRKRWLVNGQISFGTPRLIPLNVDVAVRGAPNDVNLNWYPLALVQHGTGASLDVNLYSELLFLPFQRLTKVGTLVQCMLPPIRLFTHTTT